MVKLILDLSEVLRERKKKESTELWKKIVREKCNSTQILVFNTIPHEEEAKLFGKMADSRSVEKYTR